MWQVSKGKTVVFKLIISNFLKPDFFMKLKTTSRTGKTHREIHSRNLHFSEPSNSFAELTVTWGHLSYNGPRLLS